METDMPIPVTDPIRASLIAVARQNPEGIVDAVRDAFRPRTTCGEPCVSCSASYTYLYGEDCVPTCPACIGQAVAFDAINALREELARALAPPMPATVEELVTVCGWTRLAARNGTGVVLARSPDGQFPCVVVRKDSVKLSLYGDEANLFRKGSEAESVRFGLKLFRAFNGD
jgi:hypothetical protein